MACRGRSRLPEVRRGQGERGTGPDRPDLRSRRVRRGIPAESGGARRKHHAASALPTKAFGRPAISAISRAGRSRARRRRPRPKETIREIIREAIRETIRRRHRGSRPMPRRRTARSRCPRRASPRRRMTSICRPKACRHRATAAIWRHRPIRRATVTRRLLLRRIRSHPIRHRRQRRPRRGSGPRRAIPSAPSGRSR